MDLMDRSNSSVAILGSYKLSCFLREVENRNYVASVTGSAQLRFSPLYLKVQVLELLLGVRKHLRHSCAGSSVKRDQLVLWLLMGRRVSLRPLPEGTLLLSSLSWDGLNSVLEPQVQCVANLSGRKAWRMPPESVV